MARTAVAPAGNDAAAGIRISLSGTHLVRTLLLTPWVFYLLSPFVLQYVHLRSPMLAAPVPIVNTHEGYRARFSLIAMGFVGLVVSHALEAGRRGKLPTPKHASSSASDASTALAALGGCFSRHLHARSMLVWDAYDCVEAITISACLVGGILGDRILNQGTEFQDNLAALPTFLIVFAVVFILKRVLSAITDVQRERMPAFVMGTAVPTLALTLCFMLYLTLVYANAALSYPYYMLTERLMALMLATGNNSDIRCDDEAAFWDTIRLPFTFEEGPREGFTYDCMEPLPGRSPGPLCGYRSWKDLCQAWRLSFMAWSTGKMFQQISFTVPILAIIFIVLVGSGRIARTVDGELDLNGLLAPHILLILGLATVSSFITLNILSVFFLQAPLVMQGQALADPLAGCGPGSFCSSFDWVGMSLASAALVLLPIDTLKRVLNRYGNRKRTYFLSYKQNDGNDGAVQMLANLLGTGSVWFDKYAADRSETGMVNGVTSQDIFVAILSPNYFQSKFCCLEMRTALKMGKPVLVVWNQSKSTVQTALGWVQALPQFELAILLESEPPVLKPNPLS